jgi:molybdopterin-biosynthesis enzyme MoeA-like protein
MAWPMMAWVLDTYYSHLFQTAAWIEQSVIVMGAMEAALTPLMQALEQDFAGIKVFSLPSVDHPQYGRHIELGVKGAPDQVAQAYPALLQGLQRMKATLGPELVRS